MIAAVRQIRSSVRLRPGFVFVVLGLVVLAGAGPVPGAVAATHTYSAEYTGSAAWSQDQEATGSFLRTKITLSWRLRVYGNYPDGGTPTFHRTLVAQGSISEVNFQGGGTSLANTVTTSCTLHQSDHPDLSNESVAPQGNGSIGELGIPQSIGTGASNPGQLTITGSTVLTGANPTGSKPDNLCEAFEGSDLLESFAGGGSTVCGLDFPNDSQTDEYNAATSVSLPAPNGSAAKRFVVSQSVSSPNKSCTETMKRTLNATAVVGGAAPPPNRLPSPATLSPASLRRQKLAKQALQALSPQAIAKCGLAAGGISLTVSVGALPWAAALLEPIVTGPVTTNDAKECAEVIEKLSDQYQIYINDPPNSAIGTIALPETPLTPAPTGCSSVAGADHATCETLINDSALAAVAATKVASIQLALTATSNRLATARKAGNSTDTTLQTGVFAALSAELVPALETENTDNQALAKALNDDHITIEMTAPAVSAAVAKILAGTTALGVPTTALRSLAQNALTPKPLDYGAVLSTPITTTTALAIARSITLGEIDTIFTTLDAAGQIPPHLRTNLTNDVSTARNETGAALHSTLLKFATAATSTTNPATQLLAAAARDAR